MRVISLLGVFLLLCAGSAQEQRAFAAIHKGDTELGWIDDRPSEESRKLQEEIEHRNQTAKAAMRNMMMGLRFEKRDVPVVRIPFQRGLSVCFMSPWRDGVFLVARRQGRTGEGHVLAQGYYFDPANREIHRIRVAEVNDVHRAVVAGERAWFAGLTNGKTVLVGIGEQDRITVPLPQADEIPDLGLDGQSLLAVYSKTLYRLTDRQWTLVHSGDIVLPRSGLPPQRRGNMVFIRDEGRESSPKRLWLLNMVGQKSHPLLFGRDIELAEPIVWSGPPLMVFQPIEPPAWEETSSYCVTSSGDLWACVANGSSLVRRSKDGSYSIAIANNSVQFREDPINSWEADQGLRVSAIRALPDDSLLLAGLTGLYRLEGNKLIQEIAFAHEEISDSSARVVRHWGCDLTHVLPLDDQSYVISRGSGGGVYLLRPGNDGQWSCLPIDVGEPVVW